MLQPVGVGHKALADYTHLVGRPLVEEIKELAEDLKGLRILHLSATAFGGGVSEILYTLVPLMRDVEIDAHWQVMLGREEFYNVTKLLHNALQGNPQDLTPEQWQVFAKYNEMNALDLKDGWDVIIVHDPQPAAIPQYEPDKAKRWIWRCHIDLSTPNPTAIERIVPLVRAYNGSVFHLDEYVPQGLRGDASGTTPRPDGAPVHICPPAIDPLSPKNMAFSPEDAAFVCEQFGIDPDSPLMCQVSRFDPWKDPMGVIVAYRLVKEELPGVQVERVCAMDSDDAEGWAVFNGATA